MAQCIIDALAVYREKLVIISPVHSNYFQVFEAYEELRKLQTAVEPDPAPKPCLALDQDKGGINMCSKKSDKYVMAHHRPPCTHCHHLQRI